DPVAAGTEQLRHLARSDVPCEMAAADALACVCTLFVHQRFAGFAREFQSSAGSSAGCPAKMRNFRGVCSPIMSVRKSCTAASAHTHVVARDSPPLHCAAGR